MKGETSQPHPARWTDLPPLAIAGSPRPYSVMNGDIHLWLVHLQAPAEVVEACAILLSPDEAARTERFRFQHLRDRYTLTRGAVRQILSSYLDIVPKDLQFHYNPQGKPSLPADANPTRLTFNLSHSENLAMLAIANNRRIGIDIEHRKAKPDLDRIATRSFSRAEAAALSSLPDPQRTDAFYACWTLKEAYLKATGDGLSTPLDSFEVQFPPIAPAALAGIASSPGEHLRWQAYSFTVDQHAAALIVEGRQHTIYRASWNPQTGRDP